MPVLIERSDGGLRKTLIVERKRELYGNYIREDFLKMIWDKLKLTLWLVELQQEGSAMLKTTRLKREENVKRQERKKVVPGCHQSSRDGTDAF